MVDCGTIQVDAAFSSGDVTITDCGVGTSNATVGDSVNISPVVQNNNDTEVRVTLEVLVNGSRVEEGFMFVSPGESRQLNFTLSIESAGTLNIESNIISVEER